jgi:Ner family transcriptional regulator
MITESPITPPLTDWHRADIKAALEKAGWTLRKLSIKHGYCVFAAAQALHRPWPRMERIIARAIGVRPSEIWPSRYASKRPLRRRSGTTKDSDTGAKSKRKNAEEGTR